MFTNRLSVSNQNGAPNETANTLTSRPRTFMAPPPGVLGTTSSPVSPRQPGLARPAERQRFLERFRRLLKVRLDQSKGYEDAGAKKD